MAKTNTKFPWADKIINPAQIAGIETSVLDNGLGRGSRIAWVNTGTSLRYKVAFDRSLDILDAFYNEHNLIWLSHAGATAPRPHANYGLEWLYTFGGGLLTTCGLTHMGPPETDENGQRGLHGRISNIPAEIESIIQPLHGRISNIPAEIESIIQPDPINGKLDMSITGTMKQSRIFTPNLELKRTISSTIGQPTIRIHDVVTNHGNATCPHMIIYHCNFGWPLIDEGTDIVWKGKWQARDTEMDRALFNSKHNFRKCQKPLESHRGTGEACGFIDITADRKGFCTAGLYNRRLSLAVAMKFKKKQLPWLTNWQSWGFGEYVCGLEPGTNPPIGQIAARKQKQLVHIKPGKTRTYDLKTAGA